MDSEIMVENTKQVVISQIDTEEAHFLGFVKSNIDMTKTMRAIAKEWLDALYQTWTHNYDTIIMERDSEYRYQSLKAVKYLAFKSLLEKEMDPRKVKMSITAVCAFPQKEKALWLNTGSEMLYAYRGGKKLYRLCTQQKALKRFRDQSIFNSSENYYSLSEGDIEDNTRKIFVVSSEATEVFEKSMQNATEISQEQLKAFAQETKRPIIIGTVFNF